MSVRLNLGCGPVQPEGWINVDGSMRAWLVAKLPVVDRLAVAMGLIPPTDFKGVRYERLERRWRWTEGSVDAVYSGEMLEHFTRADGEAFLRECFRVLRPGGVIRLRVPDNARFWQNYLNEFQAARSRPRAEWTTDHSRWIEMFFREICVERKLLGSYGHFHKWMYDEVSLVKALERAGFGNVERRTFLDSSIPDIGSVEMRDDLIVEGIR